MTCCIATIGLSPLLHSLSLMRQILMGAYPRFSYYLFESTAPTCHYLGVRSIFARFVATFKSPKTRQFALKEIKPFLLQLRTRWLSKCCIPRLEMTLKGYLWRSIEVAFFHVFYLLDGIYWAKLVKKIPSQCAVVQEHVDAYAFGISSIAPKHHRCWHFQLCLIKAL